MQSSQVDELLPQPVQLEPQVLCLSVGFIPFACLYTHVALLEPMHEPHLPGHNSSLPFLQAGSATAAYTPDLADFSCSRPGCGQLLLRARVPVCGHPVCRYTKEFHPKFTSAHTCLVA